MSPELYPACPLPALPLRRGTLNQMAYSLFLFIRDVCAGDLVGWLDERLTAAGPPRGGLIRPAAKPPTGEPLRGAGGHGPKTPQVRARRGSAGGVGSPGQNVADAVSTPLRGVYGLS